MTIIRRLHVPLRVPEDVIPHLGAPHHWKAGRSAKCLVDQWWSSNGIPPSVRSLLDQAEEWRHAELVDAFVERCTDLEDTRPSPSQTDLLAVIGFDDRLAVLAIEAKVDEGFDKTVAQWLAVPSTGKTARLAKLCRLFGLDPNAIGHLRYQLLHRTAAAVLEAKRYRTTQAAMIVQSWCPRSDGLQDYADFCTAIGFPHVVKDRISDRRIVDGVSLRTAWSAEYTVSAINPPPPAGPPATS